jgi:hypothetical protein
VRWFDYDLLVFDGDLDLLTDPEAGALKPLAAQTQFRNELLTVG